MRLLNSSCNLHIRFVSHGRRSWFRGMSCPRIGDICGKFWMDTIENYWAFFFFFPLALFFSLLQTKSILGPSLSRLQRLPPGTIKSITSLLPDRVTRWSYLQAQPLVKILIKLNSGSYGRTRKFKMDDGKHEYICTRNNSLSQNL